MRGYPAKNKPHIQAELLYTMNKTTEQKKQYYAQLRAEWNNCKAQVELGDSSTEMIYELKNTIEMKTGKNVSPVALYYITNQMKEQGITCVPYLQTKTFNQWKSEGYMVKKGEKSTLHSLTWKPIFKKDKQTGKLTEDIDCMFPKAYNLFTIDQVEKVGEAKEINYTPLDLSKFEEKIEIVHEEAQSVFAFL